MYQAQTDLLISDMSTVSDVVKEPEDSVRIHPAVGPLLRAVRTEDLLPVLARVGLEPEEPVLPQVRLNVILCCKVLLGEDTLQATTGQHQHGLRQRLSQLRGVRRVMILTTVVIMSVPGQTVHLTVPSQHLLITTVPPLPTPPGEEGSRVQLKQFPPVSHLLGTRPPTSSPAWCDEDCGQYPALQSINGKCRCPGSGDGGGGG